MFFHSLYLQRKAPVSVKHTEGWSERRCPPLGEEMCQLAGGAGAQPPKAHYHTNMHLLCLMGLWVPHVDHVCVWSLSPSSHEATVHAGKEEISPQQAERWGEQGACRAHSAPCISLTCIQQLELDKELEGQWNSSSSFFCEHPVQLHICLFLN